MALRSQGSARWGCGRRQGPLCLTLASIGPQGLGLSSLSRATLPSVRLRPSLPPKGGHAGVWLCPTAPWTPRAAAAPHFWAGQLHNLPQLCSEYCVATGREFQGFVCTRTNLPSCCLAAGLGVSLWAPGNGGVLASKRAWPASRVRATAPPCWYRLCAPKPQLPRESWTGSRTQRRKLW